MRTIQLYQIQYSYVVGSAYDLNILAPKIVEDEALFQQIEQDYKSNPQAFKIEYVSAKTSHLSNKWMYCWLLLHHYSEKALLQFVHPTDNFEKQQLKNLGWMFPADLLGYRVKTTDDILATEQAYINFFHKYFDQLFNKRLSDYTIKVTPEGHRVDDYYQQAIACYKNDCFYACVASLFPIIEYLHKRLSNFDESKLYQIKNNLGKVSNKVEGIQPVFSYQSNFSYHADLVEQFNDLATNHYFKTSVGAEDEPQIVNRNRIMHGIFTREISRKDCLQLFCVISNMSILQSMVDASDYLKEIDSQLAQLKQEQN